MKVKGAKPMGHIPWNTFLYYDETSPTFLRHLTDKHNGRVIMRHKGEVAGSINQNGYCRYFCSLYGDYAVHRIIWILHNGQDIPDDSLIDHIDGNTVNNNISNLRLVKEADNTRNSKIYSNNTSGKVGVYFDTKRDSKNIPRYYWKASWMELDGTQKTKSYSIEKFGLIEAQVLASIFRDSQIARLKVEGADYTKRHGT